MLSAISYLYSLLQRYKLSKLCLAIYCDNYGLVKRINNHRGYDFIASDAGKSDSDAVLLILQTLTKLEKDFDITISINHVKGHQDETTDDVTTLPNEAIQNIRCDHMVSEYSTKEVDWFPSNLGIQILVDNQPLESNIKEVIRQRFHEQRMKRYLMSKYDWSYSTYDFIDWTLFKQSRAKFKLSKAQHQFVLGQMPFGVKTSHYGEPLHCPDCEEIETETHFFQCNAPARLTLKQKFMQQIFIVLSCAYSKPEPINFLVESMRKVLNLQDICTIPWSFRKQNCEQTKIGWINLFKGFVAKSFLDLSDDYNNAVNVFSRCIRKSLKFIRALWILRNKSKYSSTSRIASLDHQRKLFQVLRLKENYIKAGLANPDIVVHSDESLAKQTTHFLMNFSALIQDELQRYKKQFAESDKTKRKRKKPK